MTNIHVGIILIKDKFLTIFIYCIVCQMHACIFDIVFIGNNI